MLNSRSEFNRCLIPCLRLVEEEEIKEREQMEMDEEEEVRGELLDREEQWARTKNIQSSKEQPRKWRPGSKGGKRQVKLSKVVEPGAEDGGRPSKKKRFEILEEGWGENKNKAKTTDGGARKDWVLVIEEQRNGGYVKASEPSENRDTPQGEDDSQGRPPPLEETPVIDHPPLQGVSDHPGVMIRLPITQKFCGTVTIFGRANTSSRHGQHQKQGVLGEK